MRRGGYKRGEKIKIVSKTKQGRMTGQRDKEDKRTSNENEEEMTKSKRGEKTTGEKDGEERKGE